MTCLTHLSLGFQQMILAGVSCDEIFVIVLFTTFVGMAQGDAVKLTDFLNVPVSIVLGVLLGAVTGILLSFFFETAYARKHCVRNSMKVIIVLGVSFVLVGAAVDICYTMEAGVAAVVMIFIALLIRAIGVGLCMLGTSLSWKERLFCVIAYLPKATVQAAIGSVPLSLGLSCGKIILSAAVLAIVITAPLGAIGMDATYKKLLQKEM